MAKHNPVTGVRMRETRRQHAYEAPQGNMSQHGADRATHDDEPAQIDLRNREHEFRGGSLETNGYGEPIGGGQFGELAGQGGPQELDENGRQQGQGNFGPPQVHSPKAEADGRRHQADKGGIDYHRERPVEPEKPTSDKTRQPPSTGDRKSRKRFG